MSKQKFIIKRLIKERAVALTVIALVAVIGVRLLTLGYAQTFYASVEAETGKLGGTAKLVSNPNASGAQEVQFGMACTSPLVFVNHVCYYGGPIAPTAEPGTCNLSVPANPLTPTGLSTPYVLSGSVTDCQESNSGDTVFVQATILAPDGTVSVYDPLVINAGQNPAAPPVVPNIPAGSVVGIWFGSNNFFVHLIGAGASSCVNGLPNNDFGQFAYCNATQWYSAANAEINSGKLVIPPLGNDVFGATCPTVDSFHIVDQDPNDNVQTTYLANPNTNLIAQNTAANAAALSGDVVLANPSDNALVSKKVDPAIGCTPWLAPVLENPGSTSASIALDQLQAAKKQPDPVAFVEIGDEMTLTGGANNDNDGTSFSQDKNNLYRAGVDQPPNTNSGMNFWCTKLDSEFPSWFQKRKANFEAAPSPDPAAATNLYTFLGMRFIGTYELQLPKPGVVKTCDQTIGIKDPLSMTTNAAGIVTSITVN